MTKTLIGVAKLTAGNIKNHHFYLTHFMHLFPTDLIGGSNEGEGGRKSALIHWGSSSPEVSDIDGSKKIFRKRGFVKAFFVNNDAKAGDKVQVEEIKPYEYNISLIK